MITGLVTKEALRYKRLTGPADAKIAAVSLEPDSESDGEMPF